MRLTLSSSDSSSGSSKQMPEDAEEEELISSTAFSGLQDGYTYARSHVGRGAKTHWAVSHLTAWGSGFMGLPEGPTARVEDLESLAGGLDPHAPAVGCVLWLCRADTPPEVRRSTWHRRS